MKQQDITCLTRTITCQTSKIHHINLKQQTYTLNHESTTNTVAKHHKTMLITIMEMRLKQEVTSLEGMLITIMEMRLKQEVTSLEGMLITIMEIRLKQEVTSLEGKLQESTTSLYNSLSLSLSLSRVL